MAKHRSPPRKRNKPDAAPAVKPGRAPDPRREAGAAGGSRIEAGRAPGRAAAADGGGRVLLESVKGNGRRRRAVFGAAAEAGYAPEAEGGGGLPEFDASRAVP